MEGTTPGIGESGKVRSILDLLNIAKILALVIGIIGFVYAGVEGVWLNIGGIIYGVAMGILNIMVYMRMDEFVGYVNSRRYKELKDNILIWAILTIIFGVIVGILLIIVYVQLDELIRVPQYPPPATGTQLPPPPQ